MNLVVSFFEQLNVHEHDSNLDIISGSHAVQTAMAMHA